MKISTKGRYAIRIMLDLALNDKGDFIPLKNISERQGISVKYLEQIVTLLQKAGFVKSLRGNNGGYRLTKTPKDYTIGGILRITEGNLVPVSCLADAVNTCPRVDKCLTLPFWTGLQKVIKDYIDGTTLYDLLKGPDGGENFCI
ncbi:MAG: Rrf2 family transcriptional regulator [Firmicutes bacterium]|nr:Rrf2 family transcriptional regulator [Bacillota bacterium]